MCPPLMAGSVHRHVHIDPDLGVLEEPQRADHGLVKRSSWGSQCQAIRTPAQQDPAGNLLGNPGRPQGRPLEVQAHANHVSSPALAGRR